MKVLLILSIIFSCCLGGVPLRANGLPYESIVEAVALNQYMDYLVDPSANLSIDAVASEPDSSFISLEGRDQNFGYSRSAFWFRFKLTAIPASSHQLLIQVRYALIDELTLYMPRGDGTFIRKKTGRNFPMSTWQVKNRLPGFLIQPDPALNDQYIYIRARTSSSSQFPMSIMPLLDYANRDHNTQFANALYFGAMAIMAIYNVIFWVMTRQSKYGFYVGFVASSCLLVMSITGYNFEYLWPSAVRFNKISINLIMGLATFTMAFFYATSLKIFQKMPRLVIATLVLGLGAIPVSLLFLVLPYAASIKISMGYMMLGALYFITLSIYFSLLRYRTAYFFMVAFKVLLLGTIVYILKTFGLLPINVLTDLAPQVGSAVQVALLSFALADQFREVKKEKEAAQKKLLAFQDEHIRTLDAKVEEKTREIRSILTTIQQGIFTISGEDLTINPEYSEYLETIFDTRSIAQQNSMDLLFQGSNLSSDAISQMHSALTSAINEDELAFFTNASLLVHEFDRSFQGQPQYLQIDWAPILDERAQIGKILVTIRDVTTLKALERQSEEKTREMQILTALLAHPPEKFARFLKKAKQYLDSSLKSLSGEDAHQSLNQIFILMHTLKGDARSLGLTEVSSHIHELEESIKTIQNNPLHETTRLKHEMTQTLGLIAEIERIEKDKLGRSENVDGRNVSGEKLEAILQSLQNVRDSHMNPESLKHFKRAKALLYETCYESIQQFLADVTQPVASIARYLDKDEPEVVLCPEEGIYIRSEHREDLANTFLHLLRNSLDHGIESAAVRLSKGKTARGRITIACSILHGQLRMQYEDDGKGLDLDVIQRKALTQGLIPSGKALENLEIAELIFLSGFSTTDEANDISGRGVGMNAALTFIEGIGGSLKIELGDHREGRIFAFRFIMSLPHSSLELAA